MPPVCKHCKEIGHNIKRCKLAHILCVDCKSSAHTTEKCPRKGKGTKKTRTRSKSPAVGQREGKHILIETTQVEQQKLKSNSCIIIGSPLERKQEISQRPLPSSDIQIEQAGNSGHTSDAEADSSDVSSGADIVSEDSYAAKENRFTKVQSKKKRKGKGGKGPKTN
ncbi:hypothetical protein V5N11_005718 [Cardamine amara subsp. amara]|uniref:Zinc finger protein n=1 Tax=Cardamine amara subsp. amara TaxID=228776 RepID=A0ABD1B5T7_CARAN